MISNDNQPNRVTTSDEDFTEAHYRQLLRAAKASYRFATYDAIPWGTRFVLWRHDLDFSINRAAALAGIEADEGVTATYFVNPRSEYYNPFEPGQARLLKHILGLGHRLGLHFDAAFHDLQDEEELHSKVAQEGRWLEESFDVRPVVFSFHNPGGAHLQCDADSYGGLVNCYSRRFKAEIPYCSDSNGYWRFRRLHDVLAEATDPCLQVLTHPGWWQAQPMPPRQRLFRCAYGRADATMRDYDDSLRAHGRLNHLGPAAELGFLRELQPQQFELCDYLWNASQFQVLLLELWRLHEEQVVRLCRTLFEGTWRAPAPEVHRFFGIDGPRIGGRQLFDAVFGDQVWQDATGVDETGYRRWQSLRHQAAHGRTAVTPAELEQGCAALCAIIRSLAAWGGRSELACDGLADDTGATQQRAGTAQAPDPRWAALGERLGAMRATSPYTGGPP